MRQFVSSRGLGFFNVTRAVCRKNARHYSTAWWQQHRAAYEQLSDRSAQRDAAACEERIVQAELDPAGPIVRAGYLEADLEKRTLTPVYWPGAMRTLLRATWFVEMDRAKPLVPLPHPIAATLERHFRNRRAPSPRPAQSTKREGQDCVTACRRRSCVQELRPDARAQQPRRAAVQARQGPLRALGGAHRARRPPQALALRPLVQPHRDVPAHERQPCADQKHVPRGLVRPPPLPRPPPQRDRRRTPPS